MLQIFIANIVSRVSSVEAMAYSPIYMGGWSLIDIDTNQLPQLFYDPKFSFMEFEKGRKRGEYLL